MAVVVDELLAKVSLEGVKAAEAGAAKVRRGLDNVEKSAKDADKAVGGLANKAGDLSEKLDQKLDKSVGRMFKGFDRMTSVVGQVTGALALAGLAVAGLKLAYDKLIKPNLESTKALRHHRLELGRLQLAAESAATAMKDLGAATGLGMARLSTDDVIRWEKASAVIRQLGPQIAGIDARIQEARRNLQKMRRDVPGVGITEEDALAWSDAQASMARVREQIKALGVQRAAQIQALGAAQKQRKDLAEELKKPGVLSFFDVDTSKAASRKPAQKKARDPFLADDTTPAEAFASVEAFLALGEQAREEQARAAAEAAQLAEEEMERRAEADRINAENRLLLIEDDTTRELEILRRRYEEEVRIADEAGADVSLLQRRYAIDRQKVMRKAALDEIRAWEDAASATGDAVGAIGDAMGAAGTAAEAFRAAQMFADGLSYGAKFLGYQAEAIAAFASYNYPQGIALEAAAVSALAASVSNFAGAAQLGKGGGGAATSGGGGGGGGAAAGAQPSPRDLPEDDTGPRETTINVRVEQPKAFLTRSEARMLREELVAISTRGAGRGGRRAG